MRGPRKRESDHGDDAEADSDDRQQKDSAPACHDQLLRLRENVVSRARLISGACEGYHTHYNRPRMRVLDRTPPGRGASWRYRLRDARPASRSCCARICSPRAPDSRCRATPVMGTLAAPRPVAVIRPPRCCATCAGNRGHRARRLARRQPPIAPAFTRGDRIRGITRPAHAASDSTADSRRIAVDVAARVARDAAASLPANAGDPRCHGRRRHDARSVIDRAAGGLGDGRPRRGRAGSVSISAPLSQMTAFLIGARRADRYSARTARPRR